MILWALCLSHFAPCGMSCTSLSWTAARWPPRKHLTSATRSPSEGSCEREPHRGADFYSMLRDLHVSLAVHRLLLNALRFLCLSCRRLRGACTLHHSRAPSTSEPPYISHLMHVACSRYAPTCSGPCAAVSHCCSAGLSGLTARLTVDLSAHLPEHLHPFSFYVAGSHGIALTLFTVLRSGHGTDSGLRFAVRLTGTCHCVLYKLLFSADGSLTHSVLSWLHTRDPLALHDHYEPCSSATSVGFGFTCGVISLPSWHALHY